MSTAELKLDLINRIDNLKDLQIIEELKNILDFETSEKIFPVSDAQRKRLSLAATDRVLSEEEADREIEKWLSEK